MAACSVDMVPDILCIYNYGGSEVIRINSEGRLYWHGREVETDDEFRFAVFELVYGLVNA